MTAKTEYDDGDRKVLDGGCVKKIADYITVEPIIFCNFLAFAFFRVAEQAGLYQVICTQNYRRDDATIDCQNMQFRPDIEDKFDKTYWGGGGNLLVISQNYVRDSLPEVKAPKASAKSVQKDTSVLNIYISMAYLLPALISDTIMGAWADRSGRKINILIGLGGLIVTLFPYTVLFTFPLTPIWILIVANVFGGLSGYIAIVMISTSAYLTDVVFEKKDLTLRISQAKKEKIVNYLLESFVQSMTSYMKWSPVFSILGIAFQRRGVNAFHCQADDCQEQAHFNLYVFNAASACIGSFSAGALVRAAPLPYVVALAEFILFCGFLYTLIRIRQIPPVIMRKMVAAKRSGASNEQLLELYKKSESDKSNDVVTDFAKLLIYVKNLYKEVAVTFTKPRSGRRRCRLWICCYIFFVFLMTELGLMHGPILGLFVFYRPFYWSPELLGYWKGTQIGAKMKQIDDLKKKKNVHF
uniref:Uncharacterized protein n=1 Tax=Romanomermis culicivorax TaxID=13658 RepID=A0A915KTN7_ROMCU